MGPQEPKAALGVRGFPTESTKANGLEPRRETGGARSACAEGSRREAAVFAGAPAQF